MERNPEMNTSTDLVDFALITRDQRWIKRHNAQPGPKGRVIVQVPASEVEGVKMGKGNMLRHRFADAPKDGMNVTVCPDYLVPETAARYTFEPETGVPAAVLEFMRQQGRR